MRGWINLNVKNHVDIAKNLRTIEWLKAELVESVSALFKALLKTGDDAVTDCLGTIIITTYILGRRLGISFQSIDFRVESKLRISINDAHEVEKWYGDLSVLLGYLENRKQ
ncbi:MAG: MazG-like family protein [Ignavibacteriales bacterium]